MTTTFGLDENNDLFLNAAGNLAVLTGQSAVAQCCATASKAQLGEMILETKLGIPNFQTIWIGTPNYSLWQSYLISALNNVFGVTKVVSVTYSSENNILSYTATIDSLYGLDEITGALLP